MAKFKLALFDFDGTLADSFPFFVSVFNRLARQHQFKMIDITAVDHYRGYTVPQMMQHLGMPGWKLPIVARSFMGLMKENSHDIPLFEGITELLHDLDYHGVMLGIVTSNSRDNVHRILGSDNMACIRFMESGSSIFSKASRIRRILNKSGVPHDQTIYIGDQVADIEAARKINVAFGAVSWGYATIDSLRQHHPEYEFASIEEIRQIV